MTVLMSDASRNLHQHPDYNAAQESICQELLYADDTLIVQSDPAMAKLYMEAICEVGAEYGLEFNWSKLEVLAVNDETRFWTPTGEEIPRKERIKYLGCLLNSDGRVGSELSCRLGAARADFETLVKIWSHSDLSTHRKHEVFQACIASKLLYCLHTTWLNKSEINKIDAFQARCLRRLIGVRPSYWSRVPNQTVRERVGAKPFSQHLLQQQLLYFGEVARRPNGHILRDMIFEAGSVKPIRVCGRRRRGRPRNTWADKVFAEAVQAAGGDVHLNSFLANTPAARSAWHNAVLVHCSNNSVT